MPSTNYSIPINGTKVAIGPFPFPVRSITVVNKCQAGTLFVVDDQGTQYNATPATAETWSADDTVYMQAYIDTPQTTGALQVIVSDQQPQSPVNSAQLSTLASIGSNVQRVSGLPSQPFDGQVIALAVDPANFPDVEWLLIYNLATGYWDCIGGSPMRAEVGAFQSTASAVFTDLATVGPQLTAPLKGDYDVAIQSALYGPTGAGPGFFAQMSYAVGATPADPADAIYLSNQVNQVASMEGYCRRKRKKTIVNAGDVLVAKYLSTSGTTASFENRAIEIMARRLHS